MSRRFCAWTALAAVVLSSLPYANAASMVGSAYEPFDYATGATIVAASNLNGGRGWNAPGDSSPNAADGNWGNAAALPNAGGASKTVTSPTLTYAATGYPAGTGNKATIGDGTTNATNNVSRLIGKTVDTGAFYFSYLTKRNNDTLRTTSLAFFGPSTGTTAPSNVPERVSIGQIGTGTAANAMTNGNIGLFFNNSQPGGVVQAATPIAYGTGVTHLILGRVDFNPTGNDTMTIYVDPTDVTTEPATPYIQSNAFELTSFNSIRFFSGNQAAAVNNDPIKPPASTDFDEIRIGSTWASVTSNVPEPNSCGLALVAAVMAGIRRKRIG